SYLSGRECAKVCRCSDGAVGQVAGSGASSVATGVGGAPGVGVGDKASGRVGVGVGEAVDWCAVGPPSVQPARENTRSTQIRCCCHASGRRGKKLCWGCIGSPLSSYLRCVPATVVKDAETRPSGVDWWCTSRKTRSHQTVVV